MDELEVPLALAGLQIDADEAFREQVVAGSMAAIEVRGGRLDRQVDETQFFVDADLAPDADVPVARPRPVLPRLAAVVAGPRNGVELPELLPRAHVEGADEPFRVVVGLDGAPLPEGGTDYGDVARDRRCRVHADFTGLEINLLLVAVHDADFQVDEPVLAERGDRRAGLRVQLREPIARRDVDDALVAAAVGPVGQASARQLTGREAGALPFTHAVRPDQLAGLRIDRDDRPARAGGRIQHAPDHQRRPFELVLRERAERVGLEAPCDLELAEVRRVDLVER